MGWDYGMWGEVRDYGEGVGNYGIKERDDGIVGWVWGIMGCGVGLWCGWGLWDCGVGLGNYSIMGRDHVIMGGFGGIMGREWECWYYGVGLWDCGMELWDAIGRCWVNVGGPPEGGAVIARGVGGGAMSEERLMAAL